MLTREAGPTIHFLQVTMEGGEKKKKSQSGTESLVHSLGLLGSKQRSHSCCLSRMWQLLEESCLLLASVSHFGMGGSSLSP